jgi:hypothetical protein
LPLQTWHPRMQNVRCWEKSGKHLLSWSFSAFDPTRTLAFARTARHAVKGRAEATRFKGRFSELIVALIKLAALQVRLGTIATEAAWTLHSKVIQSVGAGDRPMQSAITEEKSMQLRVPLS